MLLWTTRNTQSLGTELSQIYLSQGELQSSQLARRYNEYRQILQELWQEVLSKVLL